MLLKIAFLLIVVSLWGLMFERALKVFFNKDFPFIIDMLLGTLCNAVTLIAWIASFFWQNDAI